MNTYSLNARVYPVLLALFPVIILGVLFSVQFKNYYQSVTSLGISTALYFLFSQLGRDRGERLEKALWKKWGGVPTTQLFRFSNKTINSITKKRYHEAMNKLVKSSVVPDNEVEKEHPGDCDDVYRAWTNYLIAKTRDATKFKLLFSENINYGFRRNTYGLKPFAIIVLLCLYIVVWIANFLTYDEFNFNDSTTIISQFILLIPLIFWLFIVNEKWVKVPAFAYAERLLEAIDEVFKENSRL